MLGTRTVHKCGKVRYGPHRFAYELLVGPIPKGLTIDHVKSKECISTLCVNPAHLEAVTLRENILRGNGLAAMNAKKTHCPQGHPYDYVNSAGARGCSICRGHRMNRQEAGRKVGLSRKNQEPWNKCLTKMDDSRLSGLHKRKQVVQKKEGAQ